MLKYKSFDITNNQTNTYSVAILRGWKNDFFEYHGKHGF